MLISTAIIQSKELFYPENVKFINMKYAIDKYTMLSIIKVNIKCKIKGDAKWIIMRPLVLK